MRLSTVKFSFRERSGEGLVHELGRCNPRHDILAGQSADPQAFTFSLFAVLDRYSVFRDFQRTGKQGDAFLVGLAVNRRRVQVYAEGTVLGRGYEAFRGAGYDPDVDVGVDIHLYMQGWGPMEQLSIFI